MKRMMKQPGGVDGDRLEKAGYNTKHFLDRCRCPRCQSICAMVFTNKERQNHLLACVCGNRMVGGFNEDFWMKCFAERQNRLFNRKPIRPRIPFMMMLKDLGIIITF